MNIKDFPLNFMFILIAPSLPFTQQIWLHD